MLFPNAMLPASVRMLLHFISSHVSTWHSGYEVCYRLPTKSKHCIGEQRVTGALLCSAAADFQKQTATEQSVPTF